MVAARTAHSTKPAKYGGNKLWTILTKTSCGSERLSEKKATPISPMQVAAISVKHCHVIPIYLDLYISATFLMPINLVIICGWPKYPRPHPTVMKKICNSELGE